MIRGSLKDHYKLFTSYIIELKRVNKDNLFDLSIERPMGILGAIFKRFYVGFKWLRIRILQGCKQVISLDGCFLKTQVGGQLLSTMVRDGNNRYWQLLGLL